MTVLGGINMGDLTDFLFVFLNGSVDANWQGASKGYVGNVAVNGLVAAERTSGFVPYAGTIFTNAPTEGAWQAIIDENPGQAFGSVNQVALLNQKQIDFNTAFAQINALPATPGFESVDSSALNGLNFQNGICETIVINVTSGFTISQELHIAGDACDTIVIRWDFPTYANQIKFQSGGAVVPEGGLTPGNFINTAGDIGSSGGGTTPPPPYPQGPRFDNGLGDLIAGGQDFSGGGFFTGYWLTIGDPVNHETSSLSNAIFVGGWYTTTTKFSMTSGTSGVYVAPAVAPCITLQKFISIDGGLTFVKSNTPPGVVVPPGVNPVFRYFVTNCGTTELTGITLTDTKAGAVLIPTTTLAPGASFEAFATTPCEPGQQQNVATVEGFSGTTSVTASDFEFYVCQEVPPCISLQKFISIDGGVTFVKSNVAPGILVPFGVNPVFRYIVTNCGSTTLTSITLNDSILGAITIPTTTLAPGGSFEAFASGSCSPGTQNQNVATVQGFSGTTPLTATDFEFYRCEAVPPPCISLQKFISVNGGVSFQLATTAPGPTVPFGVNPIFRFFVTNCGQTTLTGITLNDSILGAITIPTTTLAPGGSFDAFATGTCTPGTQNHNVATVQGFSGTTPVTATAESFFVCQQVPPPCISLQKFISVDGGASFQLSTTAPGVTVPFGVNPIFRFLVTNCGQTTLTGITLNDSILGAITIPTTTLAPGGSFDAFANGTCTPGQQGHNVATVQGFSGTTPLTATAESFFVCQQVPPPPCISIQKFISINGGASFQLSTTAPGVTVPFGVNPIFRYFVTNCGTTTLTQVTVTDSVLGIISLGGTLAAGASFEEFATGTCTPGQQGHNTVTASGVSPTGVPVSATAESFFVCGTPTGPSITIRKLVSVDCGATFVEGTPPGPILNFPNNPIFRIIVTNNGNSTITGISVIDTTFGPVAVPTTTLAPGQSFTVTLTGTFALGQHCNTATVFGIAAGGVPLTASDSACFRGVKSPLPVFPNISNPAPQNQIIDRLLETVALEELALAAVVNAEAEKVQAVVQAGIAGPVDAEDLQAINKSVMGVVEQAAEKERTLRRKLQTVLAHKATFPTQCPPVCTNCPPDCCPAPCPPMGCPPTP